MVKANPILLGTKHTVLRERFNYGQRIAARGGWNGDVRQLVIEKPELLTYGVGKISAFARFAVNHASEGDADMPNARLARLIHPRSVESHILASLNRDDYTLGLEPAGRDNIYQSDSVPRLREKIYASLENPDNVARLGVPVLREYFRYRPLSPEQAKAYPYLKQYLPPKQQASLKRSHTKTVEYLHGNETWLPKKDTEETPEKSRADWLHRLNLTATQGNKNISGKTSGEDRARVIDMREKFFSLLGWSHESHPLHREFKAFQQDKPSLVPPENVVKVMQVLTDHGVRNPPAVLSKYFKLVAHGSEGVNEKLQLIEEMGLEVNAVLENAAHLLRFSPEQLRAKLQQRIDSGRASYARKHL